MSQKKKNHKGTEYPSIQHWMGSQSSPGESTFGEMWGETEEFGVEQQK